MRRWTLLGAVILLGACGPSVGVDADGTTGADPSTSTAGEGDPTTASSVGTTPDPSTTMTSADASESGEWPSFVGPDPDVDTTITGCSIWERDCPPGMKCMPYANDGGSAWNDTLCVPVVDEPRDLGDPCTAFDGPLAGYDDCDIHAMCWDVDETNTGTCVGFCTGSELEPTCEDPVASCVQSSDGPLNLCLPRCHPIDDPCPAGSVCVAVGGDEFHCVEDGSGDTGAAGDPCEFVNACDAGLFCAAAEYVPECAGLACCAPFCNLADAVPCPDAGEGVECFPYWREGQAPPGYEQLGVCVVPP